MIKTKHNYLRLLFIILFSVLFSSSVLYWQYQEKYNQSLSNITIFPKVLSATVNPDLVQSIIAGSQDNYSPELLQIREQFLQVADSGKDIRYVYLMALSEEGVYFITDAQPSSINNQPTDPSILAKFGELYPSADANLLDVFYGKRSSTIGTGSDKWGKFISVALPIYSSDKTKIIAVVGVDIDQTVWNNTILLGLFPAFAFVVLFFIFITFIVRNHLKTEQSQSDLLYFASIFNSTNDAIIGLSFDGTVLTWNMGAEKILGYTSVEMVGKNIKKIVPLDKVWEVDNYLGQAKIGQSISIQNTQRLCKDKSIVNVSITSSPIISSDGDIIGVSIIEQNTTVISKQLDSLVKKNMRLEKMNSLLVGRELEMIKLKKMLNQ